MRCDAVGVYTGVGALSVVQMTADTKYLERGTIIMIAAGVGGFFADYALNLGVARFLAPYDYGDFKVAMAFLNISAMAVLLGGDRAAPRFLAARLESDDRAGVWEYVRLYLVIMVGLSLVLIALTIVISLLHFGPTDLANRHPLLVASLVIPLGAASTLLGRIFLAAKRVDLANLPWRVGFPLAKLVLVLVVAYVVGEMTDIRVLWLAFVTAILLLAFQIVYAQRLVLVPIRRDRELAKPKDWLRASIPMMLVMILQVGLSQVDLFMIEVLADESDVGYFGAASTSVHLIVLAQTTGVGLLAPLIAGALQDGTEAVADLHVRGFRILLCLAIPTALGLVILAPQILSLFGSDYTVAAPALTILVSGYFVSTVLALSAVWLQYAGNEQRVMWVMLSVLLASIVLNFLLIPPYGINGAAAGTALVLAASGITFSVLMRRHLDVSPCPIGAALAGVLRHGKE